MLKLLGLGLLLLASCFGAAFLFLSLLFESGGGLLALQFCCLYTGGFGGLPFSNNGIYYPANTKLDINKGCFPIVPEGYRIAIFRQALAAFGTGYTASYRDSKITEMTLTAPCSWRSMARIISFP